MGEGQREDRPLHEAVERIPASGDHVEPYLLSGPCGLPVAEARQREAFEGDGEQPLGEQRLELWWELPCAPQHGGRNIEGGDLHLPRAAPRPLRRGGPERQVGDPGRPVAPGCCEGGPALPIEGDVREKVRQVELEVGRDIRLHAHLGLHAARHPHIGAELHRPHGLQESGSEVEDVLRLERHRERPAREPPVERPAQLLYGQAFWQRPVQ